METQPHRGDSGENRDASSTRAAYEAPTIVALGTLSELTGSLVFGVESDHGLPGQHAISGPGRSPGA